MQLCGKETNSPEKGVLQVQEIAGLWSGLVHLGNNTDVVALSVRKEIGFIPFDIYVNIITICFIFALLFYLYFLFFNIRESLSYTVGCLGVLKE